MMVNAQAATARRAIKASSVGTSRLAERVRGLHELPELRAGKRTREGIALGEENAAVAQVLHLLDVLDAFGEDLHAHAVCQFDQRLDDRRGIALRSNGIDEHLVDLDAVSAELEKV